MPPEGSSLLKEAAAEGVLPPGVVPLPKVTLLPEDAMPPGGARLFGGVLGHRWRGCFLGEVVRRGRELHSRGLFSEEGMTVFSSPFTTMVTGAGFVRPDVRR